MDKIKSILTTGLNSLWLKVDAGRINELLNDYYSWLNAAGRDAGNTEYEQRIRLSGYLERTMGNNIGKIRELREQHLTFTKRYMIAVTAGEKKKQILTYAETLGVRGWGGAKDKRALKRWFGYDTVISRYSHIVSVTESRISFCCARLGAIAGQTLLEHGEEIGYQELWKRLDIEKAVRPLLFYDGDSRVRLEAFRTISTSLKQMPGRSQEGSVEENTLQYIYRSSVDSRQDVWIQCEALKLLESLSPSSMVNALKKRLNEPQGGDDLFVRRRAVVLLGENLHRLQGLQDLVPTIINDPNPYVRQAIPNALRRAPDEKVVIWFRQLACDDEVPQVRAAAIMELICFLERDTVSGQMLDILLEVLSGEDDKFVLRVALMSAADGYVATVNHDYRELSEKYYKMLLEKIENLHINSPHLSIRRYAAQAMEKMWGESDKGVERLKNVLEQAMKNLKPGKGKRLPRSLFKDYDDDTIGRVLSLMSMEDYGYCLEYGPRKVTINRGDTLCFRMWRLIYEMLNPSPVKRQAFRHTTGRYYRGTIHAPSPIMAEMTETGVPGEPLSVSDESGWRPYLPMVDEIISSLEQGFKCNTVRIYTSDGVTEIKPPGSFLKRVLSKIKLSWYFQYYVNLRNWHDDSQTKPSSYVKELSNLGFNVDFRRHKNGGNSKDIDSSIKRFFPAFLMVFGTDTWLNIKNYFFTVYENSLYELGIFASVFLLLFVLGGMYKRRAVNRARKNMPLVIGGWGSRGKSSVERLKAGLFNALGYSVLSKTTGCEAMFIYAGRYGRMRELFLFRPYDKATIWEQHNLMCLASSLNADVFLWECMGLNPSYVKILQKDWGQDDISTITNTYPDHEDIMGPAGINVAEVISEFVPKKAILVSSEEEMKPVLSEAARRLGSRDVYSNWLDAGMLTPDILGRFTYDEHPNNVALILALADELTIDRDFALKEMADRVIPDIGVLKTFPVSRLRKRRLEFTNGMSANERFAALSNWGRARFDKYDLKHNPDVWITTIVNNRADRIARSQIFAKVLVEDLSADKHFLIGTNLKGLVGYIRNSWKDRYDSITLWPDMESSVNSPAESILNSTVSKLRVPTSEEHIVLRLNAMLKGISDGKDILFMSDLWRNPLKLKEELVVNDLGDYADSVADYIKQQVKMYKEYCELAEKLETEIPSDRMTVDMEFRQLIWKWFQDKFVVIEDLHASGNQIINRICEETPPGIYNRIMGLQNIKGTGMDFVYRWQAWEECFHACEKLSSDYREVFEEGLDEISGFQDYGLLCEEHTLGAVAAAKTSKFAQEEKFQASLNITMSNIQETLKVVRSGLTAVQRTGFITRILRVIEEFLDIEDAVRRRKRADKIYKDMSCERISIERASIELARLVKRQKGGWFPSLYLKLTGRKKT